MEKESKNKNIETAILLLKISSFVVAGLIVLFLVMDHIVMPFYVRLGDEVEIPDVTERSFTEATRILQDYGFKVVKEGKYNPYRPAGIVLDQIPSPFSVVKEGRIVRLSVSLGEQLVRVPDLVGISERDAQIKLQGRNLKLGDIIYKPSHLPEGTIVSQQYEPDMELSKNTAVAITVSLGSERKDIILPNLISKSLADAENILKSKGLVLGEVETQHSGDLLPNTVINQYPPAGQIMSLGDTIFIVISRIDSTLKSDDLIRRE